ncbi:MAG: purine-nucleoside phosphorylase [Spartobacteria bacterium]|nr:purine-nucleoside phosphorylase [Spartobacteria bacterium]
MLNYDLMDESVKVVQSRWPDLNAELALVLGSGWGDVVAGMNVKDVIPYSDLPSLGETGIHGHRGMLIRAEHAGLETIIFQGRRHLYEGVGMTPIATPVYLTKKLGCRAVLLTNAAGCIRTSLAPGMLMVIKDHINFMGINPLAGPHNPFWGPRFPDQTHVYCPEMRDVMTEASTRKQVQIYYGVYLAAAGPSYETPAEINMFRTIGADAVGMSTVPEALLANAAGLQVGGISCMTNYAAGMLDQPLSHAEVTEVMGEAMGRLKEYILAILEVYHDKYSV